VRVGGSSVTSIPAEHLTTRLAGPADAAWWRSRLFAVDDRHLSAVGEHATNDLVAAADDTVKII